MTAQPLELTESEYMASFSAPMQDVTDTADQVVDLWPYAETALRVAYPDLCTCDCDVKGANLLLVCHCERGGGQLIRIISARKATKSESTFYGRD